MTSREKAVRLVDRYLDEVFNEVDINYPLELPKRLAIIAVNEIISNRERIKGIDKLYWQQVKEEIEKL